MASVRQVLMGTGQVEVEEVLLQYAGSSFVFRESYSW